MQKNELNYFMANSTFAHCMALAFCSVGSSIEQYRINMLWWPRMGGGVTLGWASLEGNGWQGISQEGGEREFMKIEERGLRRRNAR